MQAQLVLLHSPSPSPPSSQKQQEANTSVDQDEILKQARRESDLMIKAVVQDKEEQTAAAGTKEDATIFIIVQ